MQKSIHIVLAAAALFSGTMFAGLRCQVHKDDVLRERLGGVRVGMSKEDVRRLVGNPPSIIADPRFFHDQTVGEVWYFKVNPLAAVVPNCVFDKNGKVKYTEIKGP